MEQLVAIVLSIIAAFSNGEATLDNTMLDKIEHVTVSYSLVAALEEEGFTEEEAAFAVISMSILKETYYDQEFDWLDLAADAFGIGLREITSDWLAPSPPPQTEQIIS